MGECPCGDKPRMPLADSQLGSPTAREDLNKHMNLGAGLSPEGP